MWKLSYKLTKQFRTADTKGPLKVAATLKTRLERFKINLPLINALCNPGLNSRHWNEIEQLLDDDILPNKETSLRELIKKSKLIEKNLDKLKEISELASKEYALEQALLKMKKDWESISFILVSYKDTDVLILSSFDEIQAILDDHLVKTNTMKHSPFVQPFEKSVTKWFNELVYIIFRIFFSEFKSNKITIYLRLKCRYS
jgi:dynein heavy chain